MFWKKTFIPLLFFVIAALVLISALYVGFLLYWNVNTPEWLQWLFPYVVVLVMLTILGKRGFGDSLAERRIWRSRTRNSLFWGVLPIIITVLFVPCAKSLRYSFGQVLSITSLNDLAPYQESVFIEVSDWHADRMRVIPIHTYDKLPFWFGNRRIELTSLFIVPVFSDIQAAYKTQARAWLAFSYTDRISFEELENGGDRDFYRSSTTHFKRLNINDFRYLEAFPRGKHYDLFKKMAQVHHFYNSDFSGVYQGQEVDRDVLSAYYAKYALFFGLLIGLPLILILSLMLYWLGQSRNH